MAAGPVEKMILGVQTHFAYDRTFDTARVVEWVKSARIDSTRDEMYWVHVEDSRPGLRIQDGAEFTWQSWTRDLPATTPLLLLGYGNPKHDAGGQPKSNQAIAAYANYVRWLVGQTRSRVRMVEVWNEWNLKAGAKPGGGAQGEAAAYARLAKAAITAVKAVDPEVRVLVGGTSDDFPDWRWTLDALNAGALDGADGVSAHLYNYCNIAKVGADEMLERLDMLQSLMVRNGRGTVPVYVTETGWPTHAGACTVGEADAGVHTLRLLLEASQRPWLRGLWLYEAIDSGTDSTNREHRFGLLRRDGSERPAGCMVREFGATIAARPVQVVRQGPVTAAVFHDAGRALVFAWGHERDRPVRIRLRTAAGAATPSLAQPPPCQVEAGVATRLGAQLELRATLTNARPALFALSAPVSIETLQID
jgi:hypothetical protein